MITLNVRKQGGAAVITLPSDVLKLLNIEVGDKLSLNIKGNKLVIASQTKISKRYSLAQLLEGVTAENIKKLKEETKWFHEGEDGPVGREIA